MRKQAGKSINRKGVCRLVWGLAIEECCELDSFSKHEKTKDRAATWRWVNEVLKQFPGYSPSSSALSKRAKFEERGLCTS